MGPENPRPCQEYEVLLVAKSSGETLSEAKQQALQSHLAQCSRCVAQEQKLMETWRRLEMLAVAEIPNELYEKTRKAVVRELKQQKSHIAWVEKLPHTGIWLMIIPILGGLAATGLSYEMVRRVVDLSIHHHYVLIPLFGLWWVLFAVGFWLVFRKEWQQSVPLDVMVPTAISISLLTLLIFSLISGVDLVQWVERLSSDEPVGSHLLGSGANFLLGWSCAVCLASFVGCLTLGVDHGSSYGSKVFVASSLITVLLLPALYLHGAGLGHGLDVMAFGVLGSLVGSLIGAGFGATARHHILAFST